MSIEVRGGGGGTNIGFTEGALIEVEGSSNSAFSLFNKIRSGVPGETPENICPIYCCCCCCCLVVQYDNKPRKII